MRDREAGKRVEKTRGDQAPAAMTMREQGTMRSRQQRFETDRL